MKAGNSGGPRVPNAHEEGQAAPPLLEVSGLSFSYPRGKSVFSDVSFFLRAGEIFVLIGPNGSGKTTLLNCVAGLLKPECGEIRLSGKDAASINPRDRARMLCYLSQLDKTSAEYTAIDYVVMGRAPYLRFGESPGAADYARAERILASLGIARRANTQLNHLSGGERQQARVGRILMQDARIVLLDEPTNHLDYGNQLCTLNKIASLANEGYAVLMTSHAPDHALLLDGCVSVLGAEGGGLLIGDAESILTEKLLCDLYGVRILVTKTRDLTRTVILPDELIDKKKN